MRILSADAARRADLYALLQESKDVLRAGLLERVRAIPALARVVDEADPAQQLAQEARSEAQLEAGLLHDEWGPYVDDLRAQGRVYARMGVSLTDWYRLIDGYRAILLPKLCAARAGDPEELAAAILTLESLLDLAMSSIGEAYVDEVQSIVARAVAERNLYSQVFLHAPVGISILRRDGDGFERLDANPAAEVAAGADGLPRHASPDFAEKLAAAMDAREPQRWEATSRRKADGTESVYEVRAFALDDEHAGLIASDVTDIRRTTRLLEASVAELERSNRDLDHFAYVASHDLKAPLRDIDNLSQWLVEDAGDALPTDAGRHLTRLRDRVARMEGLLDGLLQYSRAGRGPQTAETVDVGEIVDAVRALVGRDGFAVAVEGDLPVLQAPRAAIELVLRNLVGNAIKHHDRPNGRVTVSARDRGAFVEIAVADDGPGIPEAYHERVFEMFQTLRPRDEVEGSGMGLAIVEKLVERFGGSVSIDPGQGRGATFRFTWPKTLPTAPRGAP